MSENSKKKIEEFGGHATTWPVKGKRRLRLDAIQRRFNALKRHDEIVPERMISDVAYIKLRIKKTVDLKPAKLPKKPAIHETVCEAGRPVGTPTRLSRSM